MGNCGVNGIYGESYPLFCVTGLIGLPLPFQICKTAVFGYLYVIIILALYYTLYAYTISETIDLFDEMKVYSPITRFRIIQSYTNVFFVALIVISSAIQSKKIRQFYTELRDVDEKLKLLNVRFDYGKAMKRDLFHLFEIMLYTTIFNLLEYFPLIGPETKPFFDIIWIAQSVPRFVNSVAIASFVIGILKTRRRLEAINNFIPNLIIVEKNVVTSLEVEMNNVFRLRLVNKIHEKLVGAATILNESHGFLLLTSFVVYFLSACGHSKTIYFLAGINTQLVDFLVEGLWLIFYLGKYFYVVNACHTVMVQVELSGQLLRDKWTDVDHHPMKQEAEAIARRVESRNLQLTACNFFVIDYPTLKKIIVALAVYIFFIAYFADVTVATQKIRM